MTLFQCNTSSPLDEFLSTFWGKWSVVSRLKQRKETGTNVVRMMMVMVMVIVVMDVGDNGDGDSGGVDSGDGCW